MIKIFTRAKDHRQLNFAFEQGGASLSYILITCMERNADYFEDHFTLRETVVDNLNRGMDCAEKGNKRMAYNFFKEAIIYISKEYPQLVDDDEDLLSAVSEAMDFENRKINPLWNAYKEKYKI